MNTKLYAGVAFAALLLPAAAFAQSTGSTDFESEDIVVTGSAKRDVGGIRIPDSPKAKVEISQELIQRQQPGQSINQILNLVPGVSFTNNDPFGSSGGSFTIRGFDSSRISQTFDGLPLNDSGNYALYSNQQIDPELLENVNVNLGSTDVDSPTAAAVGGTVNINTLTPTEERGASLVASYGNIVADGAGDRAFHRVFGLIQTGDITGAGTKAWFAASTARNAASFANYGKVDKQQYNAKILQDIGGNGDFVALSGHYNENRNNFGGSALRAEAFVGGPGQSVTANKAGRFYNVAGGYPCQVTTPVNGRADTANLCGSDFERRFNPSNTGNVRLNSLFHLTDALTLSVDGGYQYVKANGGGTGVAREGFFTSGTSTNLTGVFGGNYYYGRDINGDGDVIDQVRILNPSQTKTNRYNAIVNLAYEINPDNRVRVSYALDTANHRQTGEGGSLFSNGEPMDVFPSNEPLADANGNVLQKRDRRSVATLHLVAAEYRGRFFDDTLTILAGGSGRFFTRELNQYCFTTASNGNVDCPAGGTVAGYTNANPYVVGTSGRPTGAAAPVSRTLNYNRFTPNVGMTYNFTPAFSFAVNYAKNVSVPSTDTLYNSLYAPVRTAAANPVPETSDSFDAGFRFTSSKVQAAVTPWYSQYKNRLVSAYNIECDCTIDTNLGAVKKYGVDASVSYRPVPQLLLYAFGSYIGSEISNNVRSGASAFLPTAGKRERSAPEWLAGGRVQATLGDFDLGAQAKYTGQRFLNDINTIGFDGYTVVDLDLRYSLASVGLPKTAFQLNVSNLFDEFYVGSFPGSLNGTGSFVNFGAPRAVIGSLIVGF
jgi:iron complex outermembrane receptor protein